MWLRLTILFVIENLEMLLLTFFESILYIAADCFWRQITTHRLLSMKLRGDENKIKILQSYIDRRRNFKSIHAERMSAEGERKKEGLY